jgi:hypothetical protein
MMRHSSSTSTNAIVKIPNTMGRTSCSLGVLGRRGFLCTGRGMRDFTPSRYQASTTTNTSGRCTFKGRTTDVWMREALEQGSRMQL